jgi:hypothetical protein
MRTVLRNIPTRLYVQSSVNWTSKPAEALDFESMGRAIEFARESGLRGMELVLVSESLDSFTAVPLESSSIVCRSRREAKVTAGRATYPNLENEIDDEL